MQPNVFIFVLLYLSKVFQAFYKGWTIIFYWGGGGGGGYLFRKKNCSQAVVG